MARIRTLKPEHKVHRKVGRLTHRQYRLWVGMITEADDEGRLVADAEELRVKVFAYQYRTTTRHVEADMEVLNEWGLIRLYTVQGIRYAEFPSWREHQRINRPSPSTLPGSDHADVPPGSMAATTDRSVTDHRPSTDRSVTDHGGSERIGKERIGSDGAVTDHGSSSLDGNRSSRGHALVGQGPELVGATLQEVLRRIKPLGEEPTRE